MPLKTCKKCGKTIDAERNYYLKPDGERADLCKKCMTMFIDNYKPDTYLWALEMMDVPYIEEEWNAIRDKAYMKSLENPKKQMSGISVIGKYLSRMKLIQYKDYHWSDTERLKQKIEEEKAKQKEIAETNAEELKDRYEAGEISEAEYKTLSAMPTPETHPMPVPEPESDPKTPNFFNEADYMKDEDLPDPGAELTKEDKLYLAMKWGRLYKPSEWVELEQSYKEMEESFSINDPDSKKTLILICKVTLKANQALDMGDYDGFQKLSRTLDSMRKSSKFTAAQNKEQSSDFLDAVGQMVDFCEREDNGGPIPRFIIEEPLDKVDIIIDDLKGYTRELINQDPTLSSQIEDYLKKRELLDAQMREKKMNGGKKKNEELTDEDYIQHYEMIEKDLEEDAEVYEE